MVGGIGGMWTLKIGGRWEINPKKIDGTEVETSATHPSSIFRGLHHAMHQ